MLTTKEYVKLYSKYPGPGNLYEGWEEDLRQIKEFNKALIEKYPWLEPHNDWSGKKITQCAGPDGEEGFWPGAPDKHPDYDYEYTCLDDMPEGWRIAFGDEMVERIHQELVRFDYVDKYQITQIKEKYGTLRWYDNGFPAGRISEDYKLLDGSWAQIQQIDRDNYFLKEDRDPDHYIPWDDDMTMTPEAWRKYNAGAIYHYRVYTYTDKCMIMEILDEYERKSADICIRCGQPAEYMSKGWISPFCRACVYETLDIRYKFDLKYAQEHNLPTKDRKRESVSSLFTRLKKKKKTKN